MQLATLLMSMAPMVDPFRPERSVADPATDPAPMSVMPWAPAMNDVELVQLLTLAAGHVISATLA